jgi:hypothetical protein
MDGRVLAVLWLVIDALEVGDVEYALALLGDLVEEHPTAA